MEAAGQLFERTQVVGVRANGLALCAEWWNAIVGVANRPRDTFELDVLKLVPAGMFDRLETAIALRSSWHVGEIPGYRGVRSAR